MSDILVRNVYSHGKQSRECARILRDELDDRTVVFGETPAREREAIPDAEIVVGKGLEPELFEAADALRLFACRSAGVEHLDLEAFRDRDVAVTNASGVHSPNIAEHALGWMLMVTRRLDEGIRRQERNEWRHFHSIGELQGSRVCVVGLGAVGTAVVDLLEGFDVETVGVRHTPEKGGPTDVVYGFDEIREALVGVDYLVVACRLSEETEALVGAEELAVLPPTAVLVNVARGAVVVTDALVDALRSNQLHAAAVDVTDPEPLPADHPLWDLGNAYVTPHCAGDTPHFWPRFADLLVRNIETIDATGSYDTLENQVV